MLAQLCPNRRPQPLRRVRRRGGLAVEWHAGAPQDTVHKSIAISTIIALVRLVIKLDRQQRTKVERIADYKVDVLGLHAVLPRLSVLRA